jgi:peptidoglycan hydrolase CwlO-like protein
MKKKLLTHIIAYLLIISSVPVFAQQDKQAEKARKDLVKAHKDLKEAKIDSAADYEKFVNQAELSITENKKQIALLKTKNADESKEVADKYNDDIAALEKRNDELEKRIKEASHTKTNMWQRFKLNFNRDINKLGDAIKRI